MQDDALTGRAISNREEENTVTLPFFLVVDGKVPISVGFSKINLAFPSDPNYWKIPGHVRHLSQMALLDSLETKLRSLRHLKFEALRMSFPQFWTLYSSVLGAHQRGSFFSLSDKATRWHIFLFLISLGRKWHFAYTVLFFLLVFNYKKASRSWFII